MALRGVRPRGDVEVVVMNARTNRDLRKAAVAVTPAGQPTRQQRSRVKRLWHAVPWTQRHKLRLALAQGLLGELGLGSEARRLLRQSAV